MDATNDTTVAVASMWTDAKTALVAQLPSLAGAAAVLLLGWVVARLARSATRYLGNYTNRLLDRTWHRGALAGVRFNSGLLTVLGDLAFWVTLLLSAVIAARVAGLSALSAWLDKGLIYIPNFIVGAVIVFVGYMLGIRVGDRIRTVSQATRAESAERLAGIAQVAIVGAAIIIGLDQVGLDVTFLVALVAIGVGALVVGFSIAFGLGAQALVGDLIGARSARRDLRPGATIRIGELEGKVLEISATRMILDTAQGKALVPARTVAAEVILVTAAVPGEEHE